jgi:hypothetical protein
MANSQQMCDSCVDSMPSPANSTGRECSPYSVECACKAVSFGHLTCGDVFGIFCAHAQTHETCEDCIYSHHTALQNAHCDMYQVSKRCEALFSSRETKAALKYMKTIRKNPDDCSEVLCD